MEVGRPIARVAGHCDGRFERVRAAFAENFSQRDEIGAAVCVVADGRVVADLWGGQADSDRGRLWQRDTLVNVFSVGKGMLALCTARLMGLGRLDPDAPVARYWPEFAAAEKDGITLRQLLAHQAGLPAVRRRLPAGAMLDWGTMTDALAAHAPWWTPGAAHGYHTNTFGFLVGEVIRRVSGRSVGALFREEIALPLGADVHVGLPRREHARVATFMWPDEPPPEKEPPGLGDRELMRFNAHFNPSGLSGMGVVNTREWRRAEIPSTNGHATARGVARVYAALAAGGAVDGVRVVEQGALEEATIEVASGDDLILERPARFGLGFQLTQPERPLGPNTRAFGHFGAGGSLGFCDQEAGVAFGYVANVARRGWQSPRNRALIDAVYASLA